MVKSLHYKLGLGDEVKLTCRPKDNSSINHYSLFDNNLPQESYKINGWGWVEEEPGVFKQYYRLHAYCNKYLNYHNRVTEDEIMAISETHPFDDTELVYKSVNGDDVKIGTTGYYCIYYGGENDYYISPNFTFTSWGTVHKIAKFVDDRGHDICVKKDVILYEEVESKYNTANVYYEALQSDGRLREHFACLLLTTVDKKFVKEYVAALGKYRMKSALVEERHHDYHLIKSWLEMMGVYDDVIKLAKRGETTTKRTSTKNKKTKKEKLEDILKDLSPAERKKLTEML